jgi:uncharacterized repeat protein (TIGR01451 family)
LDGTPSSLNLASLYSSKCVGECAWTRTFKSVAGMPATYTVVAPEWVTVAPASFTIPAGGTQVVTFTADVATLETDVWEFASIDFLTDNSHVGGGGWQQGFESTTFPPTGWSAYNSDGGGSQWARTIDYYHSGVGSAYHVYSAAGDQNGWLVTPAITVESGMYFSFWERSLYPTWYYYHGLLISTGSCNPADGAFVELEELSAASTTWAQYTYDLTSYEGQTVCLAFNYQGNDADNWYIDDVELGPIVAGAPIADLHIPLAVLPTSSNIPAFLRLGTHRDADAETVSDLTAVEITDGNVYESGLVVADLETFTLAPDPTNGNPVDDVTQVFVKRFDVPAYSIRLVAEITESTSLDLDMFLYYDLNGDGMLSSADYQVASSATGAVLEYLNAPKEWIYYNQPDTYFIVVQNYNGAADDTVTLASAIVPLMPEVGNYDVILPATNPAGEPFSMDIMWNEDTTEGDRMYGYFDTCADTICDLWIGSTDLDIVRLADDVVKTADVETAAPGDTITYTLAVTNYKDFSIEYSINDMLPAGVTYVPDSVTGGAVYDELTNAITWTGTIDPGYYTYDFTTSAEDPACTLEIMPDGNPDAYLDWFTTSYGFAASPSLAYGDSFWYGTFSTYPPFNFYGIEYVGMEFTADGFAGFDMASTSFMNQNLPNPTNPNNLMAMFWDDLYTQYDLTTNKGVTMVGDGASFAVIEYDDVYGCDDEWVNLDFEIGNFLQSNDPSVTLDFEIGYFLQPSDAPGAYEIIFAYDNIHPDFDLGSSTIGVENVDGTIGTTFVYNDTTLAIEDGSAICFDYVFVPPTHVITFQVTVDEEALGLVVNEALHNTDEVYTVEESAVATVTILEALKNLYLPLIMR